MFSRGGSLLPSASADARYIDDVIALEATILSTRPISTTLPSLLRRGMVLLLLGGEMLSQTTGRIAEHPQRMVEAGSNAGTCSLETLPSTSVVA